jgi:hypothetical protein
MNVKQESMERQINNQNQPNSSNMGNPDTFIFYPSFLEQIEKIKSADVQLALFKAISNYGIYGIVPNFSDIDPLGLLDSVFVSIRRDIDDAKQRRAKVRLNGQKGGAPKGNTNAKKADGKENEVSEVTTKKQPKTTKKQPKTTKNNLDVDVDKKKEYKYSSQKEETGSSMSFGDANDTQHSSDVEDVKVGMVKKGCDINFKKLAEYFNSKLPGGGIPQIRSITQKRKAAILAREKEYGKEAIIQVINNAATSQFLNGDNNKGWTASFDWLFCKTNFPKVLEGNYRNTPARQSGTALHNSENKDYSEGGW